MALTWDGNGNLTSITPPGKTAHTFAYNLFDLVGSFLPPSLGAGLSGATTYSYNLDKQISQINRPDGAQININYVPNQETVSSINTPSGNYNFNYVRYSYLVSTLTSPDNEVLTYQYTGPFATQINSSGPISSQVAFTLNPDTTVAQISVSGASGSPAIIAMAYDRDRLLTKAGDEALTLNNVGQASATSLGKVSEVLTFNNYGEPVSDIFRYNRATLVRSDYTRDELGRIRSVTGSSNNENYQYDNLGRLTGARGNAYTYDTNGNRTRAVVSGNIATASYDTQDRLITYGNLSFQYNANGDLKQKIQNAGKANQQITSYSYDVFGNLKSVNLPNGNLIEYIVDGQNRRVGKKLNGVLTQGFVYQSQTQIAAELDGTGKITKQFVYGSKLNTPDYMIYQGKEYRIISDQVGTPKLVVDSSSGKTLEQFSMDEFGYEETISGTHVLPFGFAGGLYDASTGLVRMGARDYLPRVGRFVSKDSLGFGGGSTNLYSYSVNDPVNYIDPSGKDTSGIGFTFNGNLFGLGATGSLTYNKDTNGGSSFNYTGGIGSVAATPGFSFNFTSIGTNASSVSSLNGPGLQVGPAGYYGVGGGGGAIVGSGYSGFYYDIGLGTPGASFSSIPTFTGSIGGGTCPSSH